MGPCVCVRVPVFACEYENMKPESAVKKKQKTTVQRSARALLSICTWLNVKSFKHDQHSSFLPVSLLKQLKGREKKLCFSTCVCERAEGCLYVSFFFCSAVRLFVTLTSSSPLFHAHISLSFSISYSLCPSLALTVLSGASLFLSLSQMFFLPLGPFFCLSHYPHHFCTHLIFHLNTFSVSLLFIHTHTSRLDGSGSASPSSRPPTYHRVYRVCHHHLLPAQARSLGLQNRPSQSYTHRHKGTRL